MKFLLFTGYGGFSYIPKDIREILTNKKFPSNRYGEIIDILEKKEKVEINSEKEFLKRLEDDSDLILHVVNNNYDFYCYYDKILKYIIKMNIEDIDTSIPWKIQEYDGSEGIVYFKKPKIIDENINMAEF